MAHELLVRVVDDSPPAQSRFSTLHSRFNNLPGDLQSKILDFEDAARTGFLSSTSNWSEHQVILDRTLFEKRDQWIGPRAVEWANKVGKILLSNRCEGLIPIRKFILHIPDLPFGWEFYINNCIAFLSWNGIKELSLDNWNIITYKLSSFLFECPELTRLTLRKCAFGKSFGSFQNLRFLHLEKIAFGSVEVGDITLRTPSLVSAELTDCTGFRYLDIQAPILVNFFVDTSVRMSPDDENHMRLKLPKAAFKIIDIKPGGLMLGFRVEYIFRPPNVTNFVYCPPSLRDWTRRVRARR